MKKIAVIGGGASGLMAAITAAKNGADVTVFEKNDRIGKKILQTGNGKCNYTNLDMDDSYFYSSSDNGIIKKILSKFNEKDTIAFFENLGIVPRNRNGGIYPYPETATAILDVLRMEVERLGIKLSLSNTIDSIKEKGTGFIVNSTFFDRIIIAAGGKSAPKTGSDGDGYKIAKRFGHKPLKALPALTQLISNEKYFKSISGVRAEAYLSLYIDGRFIKKSHGELQLTDTGLSGICSFELSSLISRGIDSKRKAEVEINFFNDLSKKDFVELLRKRIKLQPGRPAELLFTGIFNKKLSLLFLKMASVSLNKNSGSLNEKELAALADSVCSLRVVI
nr:aminoacetone oxidase family FAD-binding enzyme [Lachnospiraceae bacterium]